MTRLKPHTFKYRILITIVLLAFVLCTCKKDKQYQYSNKFAAERVKMKQAFNSSSQEISTIYYSYNANGSIACITDGVDSAVYQYGDTLLSIIYLGSGMNPDNYILNKDGLISSTFTNTPYATRYEYDINRQLSKKTNVTTTTGQTTGIFTYTYTGGNEVAIVTTGPGGTSNYVADFFTDKESSLDNENFGLGFYGRNSVDLTKSYTRGANSTSPDTYYYNYYFDSRGRVIASALKHNAAFYDSVVYTYY